MIISRSLQQACAAASLSALVVLAGCTSNPAPPPSADARDGSRREERREERRDERHTGTPEADFAAMFVGRWEGVTPGNKLVADVQSAPIRLTHPYDLFLEVSGTFDDVNIRQQGYVHLTAQGRGVFMGYIPHFDPTVSALSPRAGRFSSSEANAACSLNLEPRGDGYYGETQGTTCAFAIRGAVGTWSLQVEPGQLVVRSTASGETLRFRRARS
jgi:hypothetical protein